MLYFLKNVLFDTESHLPSATLYTFLFVRIHNTQTAPNIAALNSEEMKLLIRKSKCVIGFALYRAQLLAGA